MAMWLLKTEPSEYAWDDLVREKKTTWSGVANAMALKHMRAMKKGDQAVIYHTADQRAVVGWASIASDPYADPQAGDEKRVVVDVKPKKALKRPVTLEMIKSERVFAGWDLLRIGRLSVVPVPEAMWKRLQEMEEEPT